MKNYQRKKTGEQLCRPATAVARQIQIPTQSEMQAGEAKGRLEDLGSFRMKMEMILKLLSTLL